MPVPPSDADSGRTPSVTEPSGNRSGTSCTSIVVPSTDTEPPETTAGTRLIPGLPRNEATNVMAGRS